MPQFFKLFENLNKCPSAVSTSTNFLKFVKKMLIRPEHNYTNEQMNCFAVSTSTVTYAKEFTSNCLFLVVKFRCNFYFMVLQGTIEANGKVLQEREN